MGGVRRAARRGVWGGMQGAGWAARVNKVLPVYHEAGNPQQMLADPDAVVREEAAGLASGGYAGAVAGLVNPATGQPSPAGELADVAMAVGALEGFGYQPALPV